MEHMGLVSDDVLLPLADGARYLHLTPAWVRELERRGLVTLATPGARNKYISVREIRRLLGTTEFEILMAARRRNER